jgi:hypothetical protein
VGVLGCKTVSDGCVYWGVELFLMGVCVFSFANHKETVGEMYV